MGQRKIIIVGGGAAGLMAAGQAARSGAEVLILEKMAYPARKLRITGKGRCNLTNVAELPKFIERFGRGGKFLHSAFSRFFTTELISFFEALGIETVTERGGRVFPASGKAPEVAAALARWAAESGARQQTATAVSELMLEDGHVRGVIAQGRQLPADAVILATGGASYPLTGSTGDGYRLAESAGHTLAPIRPALVPLETAGGAAALAGLDLRNVAVRLFIDGKKRREGFGELGFTEFGIDGPLILTLSGEAVDALRAGSAVALSIDLKPALDEAKLDTRLRLDLATRGAEPMHSVLRGLLPPPLVPLCLARTGIAPTAQASQVTAEARRRLRVWLKDFRVEVSGHRPLEEAIVTAGGVVTREVDPGTMASRRAPGLYFAGEILDLQADTGGYNLQAAFSTGWLAGMSAAEASQVKIKN